MLSLWIMYFKDICKNFNLLTYKLFAKLYLNGHNMLIIIIIIWLISYY